MFHSAVLDAQSVEWSAGVAATVRRVVVCGQSDVREWRAQINPPMHVLCAIGSSQVRQRPARFRCEYGQAVAGSVPYSVKIQAVIGVSQ
jgi:hypothetical protein